MVFVNLLQITVFDHRGCAEHVNKEYTGPKSGDENDEMVVEVKQTKFNRDNPKFTDMADSIYRVSTFCMLCPNRTLVSLNLCRTEPFPLSIRVLLPTSASLSAFLPRRSPLARCTSTRSATSATRASERGARAVSTGGREGGPLASPHLVPSARILKSCRENKTVHTPARIRAGDADGSHRYPTRCGRGGASSQRDAGAEE